MPEESLTKHFWVQTLMYWIVLIQHVKIVTKEWQYFCSPNNLAARKHIPASCSLGHCSLQQKALSSHTAEEELALRHSCSCCSQTDLERPNSSSNSSPSSLLEHSLRYRWPGSSPFFSSFKKNDWNGLGVEAGRNPVLMLTSVHVGAALSSSRERLKWNKSAGRWEIKYFFWSGCICLLKSNF